MRLIHLDLGIIAAKLWDGRGSMGQQTSSISVNY
jgi:hypothetical protein